MEQVGLGKGKRIRELQTAISKGMVAGAKRDRAIQELDGLVAGAWSATPFRLQLIRSSFFVLTFAFILRWLLCFLCSWLTCV